MEPKEFRTGEPVTAELMTRVVQSVITAEQKASMAIVDSEEARLQAEAANNISDYVLQETIALNEKSLELQNAAQKALSDVSNLVERANNHEFDGRDAVVTQGNGMFAFSIENGELYVYFSGEEQPNISIDETTGELIYNY